MRLLPKLLMGCAIVAVAFGAYEYFGKKEEKKEKAAAAKAPAAVPVEAVRVRSGNLSVTLSTVGSLLANESLMLRPEITGRIEAIPFDEGKFAHKGELLISIDDRVFAAELKQAEAELNLARANYSRAKLLKEKGAGTVSNFDTMVANLRVTEAKVELSRATFEKTKIIAPFDGVMGLRKVSPGDYVNPGQDLATFQSKNPMKAEFTLPETASSVLAVDQNITFNADAIPGQEFTGKIYAIDPQVDELNRNITLRAYVPNDNDVLKPGMFARISIITAQKENALFLPESAIIPRGNETFALKVGTDNKATSVPVTIGERKNGEVEILKGVAEGDVIVTAGNMKVREGQEVTITYADVPKDTAPAAGQ